jgi:hypothetical protein
VNACEPSWYGTANAVLDVVGQVVLLVMLVVAGICLWRTVMEKEDR